ncbi:hypothetical protein SKAU_G00046280 [Synaphobranchus kaupii]|uniref:Uncharacterized protein n=1 Tax=Synaphobranchus kaupii TaxID=118154 RepID=A0A9Q1G229_SYNKA|nr:hypothetical protein SKAU_G00046280 [Synaphobranchus kaupii]
MRITDVKRRQFLPGLSEVSTATGGRPRSTCCQAGAAVVARCARLLRKRTAPTPHRAAAGNNAIGCAETPPSCPSLRTMFPEAVHQSETRAARGFVPPHACS